MNEDFVSFSLAKKLKEKGYPQRPDSMSCMPYYEYDEVSNYASLCNEIVWYRVDETRDNIFAAPTISQVLKWLRENKELFVEVSVNNHTGFDFYFTIYEKDEECWIVCGFNEEWYDTYEGAALAGIEDVIENLI